MKHPIIKGLGIVVFWVNMTSCRTLKEPEYRSIENLSIQNLGAEGSVLSFEMKFFNPNNSGVKLKRAEADVHLNDNFLGHFRVDSLLHMKRKADFLLPVKLKIDLKTMLNMSMLLLQNQPVVFKFDGKAKLGKSFFYRTYPIHYENEHAISELIK